MKRYWSWLPIAALLVSLFFIAGCGLGVLAAGIGYAVSSSKSSDAEVAKAEADLQRSYNDYKLGMERINLEREKNKLQPQPIMTLQEWLQQQALPERVRQDLAEKKMVSPSVPVPAESTQPQADLPSPKP
jgi:hypothetical protein